MTKGETGACVGESSQYFQFRPVNKNIHYKVIIDAPDELDLSQMGTIFLPFEN